MAKRDEYIEKMKSQLDEWNVELSKLEQKAADAQADVKVKYQETIKELREKSAQAESKIDAVKDSSEDAWEKLKDETEHAWTAFKDGVKAFRSHYD